MRGRDVFLESLRLHGATKMFGNPGTTETPLLDHLSEYPDIEYIVVLQESIAVAAASQYAQASGKPTVANMHVAPGLGNAIGTTYGALKARSPVIVTAGAQDTRIRLREPLLGHDLAAMAEPVVKWSVQVERGDEMADVMQRAFAVAMEYPRGPVFVALPINVHEEETTVAAKRWAGDGDAEAAVASDAQLERLAALLRASRAPAIVAGDEITRAGAFAPMLALAEKSGAGIFNDLLPAQLTFPLGHPNYRGKFGADHAAARRMLEAYDCVLFIGACGGFEEVWYSGVEPFADGTRVAVLEPRSDAMSRQHPVDLAVTGELKDAIERLAALDLGDAATRNQAQASIHEASLERAKSRRESIWDRAPMSPLRALSELAEALPGDAIVVDESITAGGDVAAAFGFSEPGSYYAARGGGIGQGIAGALGAAVAEPDRPVVAISGDGSAMYSVQSFWTAAHHNLDVLFVIMSNREYRVLKHNVDNYRTRFNVPSNDPYPYMDLNQPVMSFTAMAEGMGVPGRQVTEPADVAYAVAEAMATDGPFLIDLVVAGMETR